VTVSYAVIGLAVRTSYNFVGSLRCIQSSKGSRTIMELKHGVWGMPSVRRIWRVGIGYAGGNNDHLRNKSVEIKNAK